MKDNLTRGQSRGIVPGDAARMRGLLKSEEWETLVRVISARQQDLLRRLLAGTPETFQELRGMLNAYDEMLALPETIVNARLE